jgi:hypothetical protein
MSLNAMVPVEIEATPGHILIPLGFFNRDFVYGSVGVEDIRLDSTGRTVLPMDYIYIRSLSGEILKTYHHDGIYVTDFEFRDNSMNLTRVVIDKETDVLYQTGDDQIMNNETRESSKNLFHSLVTEELETTWQTELVAGNSADKPKVLTTKEVLYEGNRYFYLNVKDTLDRYYVYSKGEIVAIYTDASDAVYRAENENGTVTNKDCRYIWKSNDRKTRFTIENIDTTGLTETETAKTTMSVCLDEMLKNAGVYVDTASLLRQGKTALEIMKDNMENAVPLALSGCSTDAMIYYVGVNSPVLATVENDSAVLIVGYDSKNLMIFDPKEGKIEKKGLGDSAFWFSSNGNRFLTYVK